MAIRRQNRTIWALAILILVLLVTFLVREGKFQSLFDSSPESANLETDGPADLEVFGDKVGSQNPDETISQEAVQLKFADVLNRLSQCFRLKSTAIVDPIPVQIETLYQKLQVESGPVTQQSDRWMNWNLKTREGQDRRLQLQITETDEGKIGRELHYFSIGPDGQLSPLPVDFEKANNPSDEVINDMLKGGEVTYKERAAVAFFSNGDRVEYIEKNNELSEIEVFRTEGKFHCADIRLPETCQCQ